MSNQFVDSICGKKHQVFVGDVEDSQEDIIDCIQNGLLHVTFPNTVGKTRLLIKISQEFMDTSNLDLITDNIVLQGDVILNFIKLLIKVEFLLKDKQGKAEVIKI